MPATPLTSPSPYCTPARLLLYHRLEQIADLVREGDGPRPTRRRILDQDAPEGEIVWQVGLAASGELESACTAGKRYVPADLLALTGSGQGHLEKLVADLWFWKLCQRSQPNSADPKQVPGAGQAMAELDRLRSGERIFPFVETAEAGLPDTIAPVSPDRQVSVVQRMGRMFGSHGR